MHASPLFYLSLSSMRLGEGGVGSGLLAWISVRRVEYCFRRVRRVEEEVSVRICELKAVGKVAGKRGLTEDWFGDRR